MGISRLLLLAVIAICASTPRLAAQCFPNITALGGACLDDSVEYVADTGANITYSWSVIGGTILSSTTTDTIKVHWTQAGAVSVSIIFTDTVSGCSNTQTYNEFVNEIQAYPVSGENPAVVCGGSDPTLYWNCYNSATGGGEHTPSWFVSGGSFTNLGSDSTNFPFICDTIAVTWNVAGISTLTWTLTHDFSGCLSSDTTLIAKSGSPLPDFCWDANNMIVAFQNESQANAGATYLWDFGDGNISTLDNPTHTYPGAGTYTVCLTVSDQCGTDSICQSVELPCTTVSGAFTHSTSGLITTFTDLSNGGTDWYWDFGDGTSSTFQSPIHAYLTPGTFTACLTVSDSCGCDTKCNTVTTSCPGPTAAFSTSIAVLEASFTNNSTNAQFYGWDFGDGTMSSDSDPIHTYSVQGNYNVCLHTFNGCDADSTCQTVSVVCPPPFVGFEDSTNLYTAMFTDTTVNSGVLLWDFGDGNTDSTANPTHVYANTGSYTVCLTHTNVCGTDSACKTITIACPAPVASFNYVGALTNYAFNDNSTNTPTNWLWNYGDGSTDTIQNPTHQFAAAGNYTVCLTVINACDTDSVCQVINVICPDPVAAFTYTSSLLQFNFSDGSQNNPTSWFWDFGDGNSSAFPNPQHSYLSAGTYTVCLTATNVCGVDSICDTVTANCPVPTSNWGFTTNNLNATFSDSSSGGIAWLWDFGDGASSTVQNPSHGYASFGNYTVCLTVTNSCGSDSTCKSVSVFCPTPQAGFADSTALYTIFLSDTSTGATSWLWEFGDGNTSVQQNPSHTYSAQGIYSVCLTALNNCGSTKVCRNIEISCPFPIPGFTWSINGNTVTFTDTTNTNFPTFWQWSFGDTTTSNAQNPTHTYDTLKAYLVCLSITDSCGTNTSCDTIDFTVGIDDELYSAITAFPNPASEFIQLNWTSEVRVTGVEVLNLLGEVKMEVEQISNGMKIDISEFPSAVYFLRIHADRGTTNRKIIIQR